MPKSVDPPVVMGVPASNRQSTIYDLPIIDMVPSAIQSHNKDPVEGFTVTQDTKTMMKEPLISHPDMNRTNQHTLETRPYRGDDEGCCDCCESCCDGVCSDETLCICLLCCCMCDN